MCHCPDVAVFKRPLGPEGDFGRLFAVSGHRGATFGILGEVDDPEPDLRLDPTGAGSQSVTDGEALATQDVKEYTVIRSGRNVLEENSVHRE